jgi:PIN domain nuclease of toxin-antitoxin system
MAQSSDPLLLLDTHVWIWETSATGQLSSHVRARINDAAEAGRLRLSLISAWEISLLAARSRIDLGRPTASWIAEAVRQSRIVFEPVTVEIAIEAGHLPDGFRSDPADQIIVATARITGAELVTRDRRILDYAARGHLTAQAA